MKDMAVTKKNPFSSKKQLEKQLDLPPTPVLGIKLAYEFGSGASLPFRSYLVEWGFIMDNCVGFVDKPTITSAKRLEAVILRLIAKTNFNNFKNPDKGVELGRYWIRLNKFHPTMLQSLFNYVLNHTSERVSKSWLPYLQELILEQEVAYTNEKFDRIKKVNKKFHSKKGIAKTPSVKYTEPDESYKKWRDSIMETEDLPMPVNAPFAPKGQSWYSATDPMSSTSTYINLDFGSAGVKETISENDFKEPSKEENDYGISGYSITTGSTLRNEFHKILLKQYERAAEIMLEQKAQINEQHKGAESLNNDIASKEAEW